MRKNKKLLITVIAITSLLAIQACRKFDFLKPSKAETEFTVEDAKEWFYGTFKKSASFKMDDKESIFSNSKKVKANARSTENQQQYFEKFPMWNMASEYAYGNLKVVEMPVVMEENVLFLPGMANASKEQGNKVSNAALNKVLFFKNAAGNYFARVVTIIPTYEYLQSKNFDISATTAKELAPDFEGYYIIRSWQNTVLNFFEVKNGKFAARVTIEEWQSSNKTQLSELNSESVFTCYELVTKSVRYCLIVGSSCPGDVPCPEPPCEEWVDDIIHYYKRVPCGDGGQGEEPNDLFGDCIQNGGTVESCNCQMFSVCDNPGDGGGDNGGGDNPPVDYDLIDTLRVSLTSNYFITAVNHMNFNGSSISNEISSILNSCFPAWDSREFEISQTCYNGNNGNDTLIDAKTWYFPNSGNVTINLNECGMKNSSREYVVAIILHEILHAFFEQEGRSTALQQHEQMGTAYANALRESLRSYFPGLSDNELTSLTWVGLEGTAAWVKFKQDHPNFEAVHNNISTNHRNGSQGTNCK